MKNEENDVLKMLAMQAKLRMKCGAYGTKNSKGRAGFSKPRGMKMYGTNFSADYKLMALSRKEDEAILEKVREMLHKEDEEHFPMQHLIDQAKFNKMSDVEKMRYALSVSEKYRKSMDICQKEIV